ncbi:hypothetical protein Droror1_Dr00025355 [Drosera rotundifolia]
MRSIRRSRATVHPQPKCNDPLGYDHNNIVGNDVPSTSLTVWKKSLVYGCDGFTVFGTEGGLVFRVDNYKGHSGEVVLMDHKGIPINTVGRTHKLSLRDRWFIYEGAASEKPMFSVKKPGQRLNSNSSNVLAHVTFIESSQDRRPAYTIEGTYAKRSCKVLDQSSNVVAEIKNKDTGNESASFGTEVFQLIVRPGFDSTLAMTMVLLLDQMFP